MASSVRRRTALGTTLSVVLGACACDQPLEVDASVDPDGGRDAFVVDATRPDAREVDALSPDAFSGADVGTPDAHLVRDAYEVPDASMDDAGFDCGTCRPPTVCETFTCESSCEYVPLRNGSACAAGLVCVDGGCLAPECGDGVRTAGEGCDDGDLDSGDGCSDACVAEVFVVRSITPPRSRSIRASYVERGSRSLGYLLPAAAVDDDGNVLVAWTELRDPLPKVLQWGAYYQRFDRTMTPIDREPVLLEYVVDGMSSPGVISLGSGWGVFWRASNMPPEPYEPLYSVIPVAGPGSGARRLRTAFAAIGVSDVHAMRLSDGFLASWTDGRFPSRVHVRRFDRSGAAVGGEIEVAPPGAPSDSYLSMVSRGGDRWTAVWTEDIQFLYREYDGASPLGPAEARGGPVGPMARAVAIAGDEWLVHAVTEERDNGTPRVASLRDGVSYPDPAHWFTGGTRIEDSNLAVASLGGGEWYAAWIQPAPELILQATSPGTMPVRGSELFAAVGRPWDLTIGAAGPLLVDGWVAVYVFHDETLDLDQLRLIRLAPNDAR